VRIKCEASWEITHNMLLSELLFLIIIPIEACLFEMGPRDERIASRPCRKNYSRMLTFAYRGGRAWTRALYAECLFNNQETSRGMHRGAGMPSSLNQNSIASSALSKSAGSLLFFFPVTLWFVVANIFVNEGICDEVIVQPLLLLPRRDESVEYVFCLTGGI